MKVNCLYDGDVIEIDIPLDASGLFFTYGDMTHYSGDDGKAIPCGEATMPGWHPPMAIPTKYEYTDVNVNMNWSVEKVVGVDANGLVTHIFTKADNKAYWDDYYEGYTSVGGLDYEKNCHGYAFDAGDWPSTAHAFIGSGWAPGELFPSFEVPVVKSSSEQFKESGVYEQSEPSCPHSVDVNKAHSYPGFTVYKQTGSCYKFAHLHRATIASTIWQHSIKITGGECTIQLPELP